MPIGSCRTGERSHHARCGHCEMFAVRARAHPPGEAICGVAAGHSPGPRVTGARPLSSITSWLQSSCPVDPSVRGVTPVAHRGRSAPTASTRSSTTPAIPERRWCFAAVLLHCVPIHPPAAGIPGTVRRFSPTSPRGTRAGAVSVPYPCRSPKARSNTSFPRSLASLTSPGVPPARGERSNRCCITSTTCRWLMTTATGPRGTRPPPSSGVIPCCLRCLSHGRSAPRAPTFGCRREIATVRCRRRPLLPAPRRLRRRSGRQRDRLPASGAGSASRSTYSVRCLLSRP